MNAASVMSYLTSRLWAMDPGELRATAEAISLGVSVLSADAISAASRAAAEAKPDGPGYVVRDGVAHVAIEGPILKEIPCAFGLFGMRATSTLAVQASIDAALYDDTVHAISLDIDSPGGSLAGVQELADAIYAARGLKPVTAHASDMCASAAYWLASQASELTASDSTMVGSIGVYRVIEDTSGADAAAGIKVHVVRSSDLKGAGAGDGITTAQLADAQRVIDEAAAMFVGAVARGRGADVEKVRESATGQVWFAGQAQERGLIDDVMSARDAHARLVVSSSETFAPQTVARTKETGMEVKEAATVTPEANEMQTKLARLEAENAILHKTAMAGVIDEFTAAGVITPALRADVERYAATCSDASELRSFLGKLPVQTRAARASVDATTDASLAVSDGDAQVANWLGAEATHLARFDGVKGYRNDGTFEMSDGRVLTKDQLKALTK